MRWKAQPVEPDYNAALSYFAARQHKRGLVLLFTRPDGQHLNRGLDRADDHVCASATCRCWSR